jgi:hypothetical protein
MTTSNPGRGLVRRLGLAAAAIFVLAVSPQQRAEALSLASPGTAPSAKVATEEAVIQVRGGHGGGGHGHGGGGGGFRGGGGFHGGGGGFHGGVIHGGGFRAAPVFRGGGYGGYRAVHHGGYRQAYFRLHFVHRHHFRRFYGPSYYPAYYGYPHRYCRVVWTYYGPRKICRYRPWHHHRHHRWHHYRYW